VNGSKANPPNKRTPKGLNQLISSQFITTLVRIVSDPAVFRSLVYRTFIQTLGFFLGWYFLISLGAAIYLSVLYIPESFSLSEAITSSIKTNFPYTLILSFKSSQLTINHDQPIVIPFLTKTQNLDNVIMIDSSASAEQVQNSNSLFLLTSKAIGMHSLNESDPYVLSWQSIITDYTLDYPTLISRLDEYEASLDRIKPFLPLILFIGIFLFLIAVRSIFVVLYTIPLVFLANFTNRQYSYYRLFLLGLHLVIIAEIVNLIQLLVYQQMFPTIFTLTFVGLGIMAVISLPQSAKS